MVIRTVVVAMITFLVFYLAVLIMLPWPADAHQAQSGWSYPWACCSGDDCQEVPARLVDEVRGGYVAPSGEMIPEQDFRLRESPDGLYHWCAVGTTTRCLFVPPRSF
jgi:hypothetical protein